MLLKHLSGIEKLKQVRRDIIVPAYKRQEESWTSVKKLKVDKNKTTTNDGVCGLGPESESFVI